MSATPSLPPIFEREGQNCVFPMVSRQHQDLSLSVLDDLHAVIALGKRRARLDLVAFGIPEVDQVSVFVNGRVKSSSNQNPGLICDWIHYLATGRNRLVVQWKINFVSPLFLLPVVKVDLEKTASSIFLLCCPFLLLFLKNYFGRSKLASMLTKSYSQKSTLI